MSNSSYVSNLKDRNRRGTERSMADFSVDLAGRTDKWTVVTHQLQFHYSEVAQSCPTLQTHGP